MLVFLSLSTAFADAYYCEATLEADFPFEAGAIDLPPDATIPVVLRSQCEGSGSATVRLHRVVDWEFAEEISSQTIDVQKGRSAVAKLSPPTRLDENTTYGIAVVVNNTEDTIGFTTGSTDTIGMDDGAPSITTLEMITYTTAPDWVYGDLEVDPVFDPDDLSFIEIFDASDETTALTVVLPRNEPRTVAGLDFEQNAAEVCFFAIQTDAAGNQSPPSETECTIPEAHPGGICSTAGATPAAAGSLMALLLGIGRRRQ